MGLLENLWDDTVAGPRPDSGLGKLRKHSNVNNLRSASGKDLGVVCLRSARDESTDEAVKVTRSIMIVRPPGYQGGSPLVSPSGSTPPISPAGSTPPVSPFSDRHSDSVGDQRRTLMRRRAKQQEQAALLLLKLSDI